MKTALLTGRNLTLGYTKANVKKVVVEGLDFDLNVGELTCLMGPNGVGKSTLVKAMMGKISPFQGEINLLGKSPDSYSKDELSKKLSVVLSEPIFPAHMTVYQLIALGRTPYLNWSGKLSSSDRNAVEEALEDTKIEYLRNERLGEISDGQRQKALIARALAQDGQIMILDEPTSHLDLVNRHEVMFLLQEIAQKQNKAILVVTHDLDIAIESAHQLWLMNCGSPLISGLAEDLILNGQINELLPTDRFVFDVKRGKVKLRREDSGYLIEGSEDLAFWLAKALEKSTVIDSKKQLIKITESPFRIHVDRQEFASIAEVINFFRIAN